MSTIQAMATMQELIELERRGWTALSTEGDAGRDFYAAVLRPSAVMLFPGGMRLEGREAILGSLGTPWQEFRLEEARVIPLTPQAATVTYRVTARRAGSPPYVALVASTYVLDGTWQLAVHQHTPA